MGMDRTYEVSFPPVDIAQVSHRQTRFSIAGGGFQVHNVPIGPEKLRITVPDNQPCTITYHDGKANPDNRNVVDWSPWSPEYTFTAHDVVPPPPEPDRQPTVTELAPAEPLNPDPQKRKKNE